MQLVKKTSLETQNSTTIKVCGLSHKSCPIELRESFSVSGELNKKILQKLIEAPEIDEAVVCSTCNRVEIVASQVGNIESASRFNEVVEHAFENISGVPRTKFSNLLYRLEGKDAVNHLFRVASGLDSLVIGEPQILGQLKKAYQLAKEEGATHALLNRLFHRAFGIAKDVRTKTKIGHNAVSVCYAARELAEQIFGDLKEASVLLIGAGEMGTLALKHFKTAGVKRLYLANKTFETAVELADRFEAVPLTLEQVPDFIGEVDIVLGAVSLPVGALPIIDSELVSKQAKRGQVIFFIDLGVPRNFDCKLNEIDDLFLYNVDDLEAVVKKNLDSRQLEIKQADLIIGDEVEKFSNWLDCREAERAVSDVVRMHSQFKEEQVFKTLKRLKSSGFNQEQIETIKDAVDDLTEGLVAKILHQPISSLKKHYPRRKTSIEVFREFFLSRKK